MIVPQLDQQLAGAVLHDVDHGVIDRVLVLLQPARHVVADRAGVVHDGEVRVLVRFGLRLGEWRTLAQVSALQFVLQRFVSSLGEE